MLSPDYYRELANSQFKNTEWDTYYQTYLQTKILIDIFEVLRQQAFPQPLIKLSPVEDNNPKVSMEVTPPDKTPRPRGRPKKETPN